ncbi:MAG: hypothetical protein GY853_16040 [PVC group bacterium]|nr:hypothetical protein [PVC group bacterium]
MDNGFLYDFTSNGYDLTNNGFQEQHPCAPFGYGSRSWGSDVAFRSLSTSSNLMITQNLTVEGFLRLEHVTFTEDTIINVGHDTFNNRYGYVLYFTSAGLVWKVCTTGGVFTCTVPISNFAISGYYNIRAIYDYNNNEIAIYLQDLTLSTSCNTATYPSHVPTEEVWNDVEKLATANCTGTIEYNTSLYDYISLAKGVNTNTGYFDYSLSSVVYSNWSIHNIIRIKNYITKNNYVPAYDGAISLGSRFRRFDSIHAIRIFGNLGIDQIKDYNIDWGNGANQVDSADMPTDTTNFDNLLSATQNTVQKALDILDDIAAGSLNVDTTNFDGILSVVEDTIQKALDVLDDISYYTQAQIDTALEAQDEFTELTDTPSSYSSQAGEFVKVNSDEDALEFTSDITESESNDRSIYVDHDTGDDSNDGTSWGDAFETLQAGINDIKPVIEDKVEITVWCRGEFNEGEAEGCTMEINRICAGSGKIYIKADDWEESLSATGGSNNTITFSGTYADDYWNNCYVWIHEGTGIGQAKKITDSASVAGTTTLTVDTNWGTNPDATSKCNIAGRARVTQDVNWRVVEVSGHTTAVYVYGFAAFGFTAGEPVSFKATNDATTSFVCCIGYGNTSVETLDFSSMNGAYTTITYCCSIDSGYAAYGASLGNIIMKRCVSIDPGNQGLSAGRLSYVYPFRCVFIGGVTSMYIRENSYLLGYHVFGSDGSSYGIRITKNAIFTQIGTQDLTVVKEDDKSDYIFSPKRVAQSLEPTAETGEMMFWRDTDDGKVYLIYNDTDSGQKKVELT